MKKSLLVTLIVLLTVSLMACDNSNDDISSSSHTSQQSNDITSTASQPDSPSSVSKSIEKPETNEAQIEEQVLYENEGIRIIAKSIDYSSFLGPELKVLIENDSDEPITVQARDCSINGLMVDPMMSADIQPDKKNNDSITFTNSELKKNGIESIGTIELKFHIFNADTWSTIADTDTIVIDTSAVGTIELNNEMDRKLVFDQDGIAISFVGFDDESLWGLDVLLFIENNSVEPITVQVRDSSINGFMIDGTMSCDVMPGKASNDSISFFSSSLEENEIEEVESVELSFHIFHKDTWGTIIDTDIITIVANS